MRPPKTILLYCGDDHRRQELAYVLWIRRNYVVEDLDILYTPDVLLVVHDHHTAEWACRHLGQRFPEVPLMVLLPTHYRFVDYGALGCTSLLKTDAMIEILEWVRVVIARKRGPKATPRKPPASEAVYEALRTSVLS